MAYVVNLIAIKGGFDLGMGRLGKKFCRVLLISSNGFTNTPMSRNSLMDPRKYIAIVLV